MGYSTHAAPPRITVGIRGRCAALPQYDEPPPGTVEISAAASRHHQRVSKILWLIDRDALAPIGVLERDPEKLLLDEQALGDALRIDKLVPIYQNVPPGYISLPSAAAHYGISRHTLRSWVHRGMIRMIGRVRGAARGGGFILLNRARLEEFLDDREQLRSRQMGAAPQAQPQ